MMYLPNTSCCGTQSICRTFFGRLGITSSNFQRILKGSFLMTAMSVSFHCSGIHLADNADPKLMYITVSSPDRKSLNSCSHDKTQNIIVD